MLWYFPRYKSGWPAQTRPYDPCLPKRIAGTSRLPAGSCRSLFCYAILAGIEIIRVRMEGVIETFSSGTQGRIFRSCPSMCRRRKSFNPFISSESCHDPENSWTPSWISSQPSFLLGSWPAASCSPYCLFVLCSCFFAPDKLMGHLQVNHESADRQRLINGVLKTHYKVLNSEGKSVLQGS